MLGFPLSRVTVEAVLVLSGKISWQKQQFFASITGSAITTATILINFNGIMSKPMAFLNFVSSKKFLSPEIFIWGYE